MDNDKLWIETIYNFHEAPCERTSFSLNAFILPPTYVDWDFQILLTPVFDYRLMSYNLKWRIRANERYKQILVVKYFFKEFHLVKNQTILAYFVSVFQCVCVCVCVCACVCMIGEYYKIWKGWYEMSCVNYGSSSCCSSSETTKWLTSDNPLILVLNNMVTMKNSDSLGC